jgi:hypothetical protein
MKLILIVMFTVLTIGCHTPSNNEKETTADPKQRQEEAARRLQYLEEHPDVPPKVKQAIEHGDVVAGMTASDARASIGEPVQIMSRGSEHGSSEQWEYQDRSGHHRWLYFDSGTLTESTPSR